MTAQTLPDVVLWCWFGPNVDPHGPISWFISNHILYHGSFNKSVKLTL